MISFSYLQPKSTHFDLRQSDVGEVGGDYCWVYLVASTVAYFTWIDLWAYLGHRALHLPFLYKTVHKCVRLIRSGRLADRLID